MKFLWREFVNPDCISLQSYDFVRSKYLISANDIFVVFSHRGTKTFSIQLEIAKKAGATTVLVTGLGSPDNFTPTTPAATPDIRIETCAQENCGAFTISLTSALVRMIQWIGLSNKDIVRSCGCGNKHESVYHKTFKGLEDRYPITVFGFNYECPL